MKNGIVVELKKRRTLKVNISIQARRAVYKWWRILGAIMLLSAIGGCLGKDNKLDSEVLFQNTNADNYSALEKNVSKVNDSKSNQVRLGISRSVEFNKTGQLNVTLNITNPRLNETVNVIFKPEFGTEGKYRTIVTNINGSTWSKKFSLQLMKNTSYVQMLIQILQNNRTARTADCNIQVLDIRRTACKIT